MDAEERCKALENDNLLAKAHEESAQGGHINKGGPPFHLLCREGDVERFARCTGVDFAQEGCLYELDGRKPFPINHGPIEDNLLSRAAAVIKEFISRENDVETFNVIALAPNTGV
ncbi:MAG: ubiquitin carboxyl-terminal hydrolase-like protein [Olpidium bornovanus]|uniref:ubiquitinyl hydrolase 1 n=1 Tax=Olpidium bornovanus TaxID=278681 RepID=A0A8H8DGP8_9FUNG|nr:MAG: ubiquitin carboxyl-terminal hydrolase-like protein [Olpidium bornovanus]